MLLAVEVGNSNTSLGLFADGDERLVANWRISTERDRMPDEWYALLAALFAADGRSLGEIDAVILSSVVPSVTTWLTEMTRRRLAIETIVVSAALDLGIRILVDNPREVGADRLVDTIAAYARYGGPAIIVDLGTATTFDVISDAGDYLGGAISTGVMTSLKALASNAAQLFAIELSLPDRTIGKNDDRAPALWDRSRPSGDAGGNDRADPKRTGTRRAGHSDRRPRPSVRRGLTALRPPRSEPDPRRAPADLSPARSAELSQTLRHRQRAKLPEAPMPNADATESTPTIRPFHEEDRALYQRIAPRLIPSETASPRDPAAMEAFFHRLAGGAVDQPAGAGTFVAVDEHDTPLGLIALLPDKDYFTGHGRAYVEVLVVAPEAEGKGVGAALMRFAEQWARERGMREVVLDVFAGNEHARRFYERVGYRTDHLRMVKPLV